MKINKLYWILILFVFTGCNDDFLDTPNLNDIGSDTFWTNEADAKLALMGCYSALQANWVFDSDPWSAGVNRLDYLTDNGYCVWGWMAGGDIPRGQQNSTTWILQDTWNSCYRGIGRCNQVIANVPGIANIDPAVANRIVAEAKVIRATFYNFLGMTFMDVPLITAPQTVDEADVPKNARAEIYAFITKDLSEALKYLPLPSEISSADFGRIDRGAGTAMLARIYLYNNQFTEAAAAAKQVMDMNYYALAPDYHALFSSVNEGSREVVYRVAFDRILDEGSSFVGYWGNGPLDYQRPLPNLANDFYTTDGLPALSSPLYNASIPSKNRDPRFSATMISNGDIWRGSTFNASTGWYYTRKYSEEDNDQDHFDSPQDFYLIRYADVLLIRAEALLRSGSYTEAEVTSLVDRVRNRVKMPSVANVEGTGLSMQSLLNIVKHERRVEFAFEGQRYFDLVRWDELDDAYELYMQSEYQEILKLGYTDVTTRVFKSLRWPLPQGELDVNHNLKQHDEW